MIAHKFLVLTAVLSLGLPPASSAATEAHPGGIDPKALPLIDEICRALVDDGHAPGVVVSIGGCPEDGPDIALFEKAYGTREGTEPATVDTLYDLASLTKPTCTAMAALFLIEDGKIAADDFVRVHIPGFDRDDKRDIRIRHLLTHTSGLPSYTNTTGLPARPDADALIDKICGLPLRSPVGRRVIYSCLNYIVLARVVENATGENLDSFLKKRLWDRIGMKDTTFFPSPEQLARTASTREDPARRGRVHDPLAWYSIDYDAQTHACGNAGGFSTVRDVARLARLLLRGGALEGTKVLEPETVALMTTQQTEAGRRTYGWGIYRSGAYSNPQNREPGKSCIGHTGYTGTFIWLDTFSRTYVILFANSVYPGDDPTAKSAINRARARVTRNVLDHLDVYANDSKDGTAPGNDAEERTSALGDPSGTQQQ